MNLFQLIFLPLIGLLTLRSLFNFLQTSQPRSISLLWITIWLLAGVTIFRPEVTIQIATMLGIGRGADLILYLLTISYLLSLIYMYNKFHKQEIHITTLIRHLAIQEALYNEPQGQLQIAQKES